MSRDSSTRGMQVNGVWICDDGRETNEEAVINPTSSYIHHGAMVTWAYTRRRFADAMSHKHSEFLEENAQK